MSFYTRFFKLSVILTISNNNIDEMSCNTTKISLEQRLRFYFKIIYLSNSYFTFQLYYLSFQFDNKQEVQRLIELFHWVAQHKLPNLVFPWALLLLYL